MKKGPTHSKYKHPNTIKEAQRKVSKPHYSKKEEMAVKLKEKKAYKRKFNNTKQG